MSKTHRKNLGVVCQGCDGVGTKVFVISGPWVLCCVILLECMELEIRSLGCRDLGSRVLDCRNTSLGIFRKELRLRSFVLVP